MSSSNSECDSIAYKIWSVFNALMSISIIIIGLYFYIQFIKRYKNSKNASLTLYYVGLVFGVISLILFILHFGISMACFLSLTDLESALRIFSLLMLLPQFYLLLLLFFLTVHHVFLETIYKFSKCIINTFKIMFITIPIGFICAIIGVLFNIHLLGVFGAVVSLLCIVCLMVFILALFIKRLFNLYHADDERITYIITKTTILTITSIFCTFIDVICDLIKQKGNHIMYGIQLWFFGIDIFTNFMCIMLSYCIFNNYYNQFCKWTHNKCKTYIENMLNKTPQTQLKINVQSQSNVHEKDVSSITNNKSSSIKTNDIELEVEIQSN